jgi:hypothetical protein
MKNHQNLTALHCALSVLLAALAPRSSCAAAQSSSVPAAQVLGDVAARLETYTRTNGAAWSAVIILTNISKAKLDCVANSYAAGLTSGSISVQATNLNPEALPKAFLWTQRAPEMHLEPAMMKRYGMGKVFELGPAEHIRLELPIYVPQAHPHDFVEHFAIGLRRSGARAYETYVAEMKQQ